MLILHQFPPALGLPNASPFCLKVETYLRLAGLEYRAVNTAPFKAPLGKLPYLSDGDRLVADSSSILDYLEAKAGSQALDAALSTVQRAQGLSLVRMLEEHSYFAMVYSRWIDDDYWPHTRAAFFATLPPLLRQLVPALVRRKMRRDMTGQGLGRHPKAEIQRRAAQDFAALAVTLGEQAYLLGNTATTVDATAYAFLAGVLHTRPPNSLTALAAQHPNLVAYTERLRARCFPEYT